MKLRTLALATVFTACAITPTLAANWDRVGSITVSSGQDRDVKSPDFGGSVERLRFTAVDSAINCAGIKATFGNGNTVKIFSGTIDRGDSKAIDLPGNQRQITRIVTNCHARNDNGGKLVIEADAGQYRSTWLRNPVWARQWARIVDANVNTWVLLADQRFVGKNDTDHVYAGWQGRSVSAIGLKSRDDAAQCTRLVATFANGHTVRLNAPGYMVEDRTYRIDLPGGERNLTRVNLSCRAVHGKAVTVRIFAQK